MRTSTRKPGPRSRRCRRDGHAQQDRSRRLCRCRSDDTRTSAPNLAGTTVAFPVTTAATATASTVTAPNPATSADGITGRGAAYRNVTLAITGPTNGPVTGPSGVYTTTSGGKAARGGERTIGGTAAGASVSEGLTAQDNGGQGTITADLRNEGRTVSLNRACRPGGPNDGVYIRGARAVG